MKIRPITLTMAAGIIAGIVALPALAQDDSDAIHVSGELVQLAEEFRAFRSPLFRPRTWRPNAIGDDIPDFAAVVEEQTEGLAEFRRRLNALDRSGWPVHDQVDYLLLRAELDDVYFEHHILREFQTNAGFYVEHAINGVARELGDMVPYTEEKAEAIIAAFERTGGILEQGPANIVFEDAAPELAHASLRHVEDIREKYAAGVDLLEPHFPESHRGRLRSAAADAAIALEEYAEWIEQSLPMMQGAPNVGIDNMEWYFERVNFSPWNTEELLAMGEYEKNRFLMSIAVEEKLNDGLKDLRMPTTEEWIEWFRLTYFQTKYWLEDMDLISFHPYIGESYLQLGTWQEPFGGVGNRPGLLGFPTEPSAGEHQAPVRRTRRPLVHDHLLGTDHAARSDHRLPAFGLARPLLRSRGHAAQRLPPSARAIATRASPRVGRTTGKSCFSTWATPFCEDRAPVN